jgi:hypothetical protein
MGAFGTILLLHVSRCKMGVQLIQKFVPQSRVELFTMNAPPPHHWTLNSCFGASRNVLVHLGPFHYCTKLGPKWAELVQLVQKFVPRSRVKIFHNERT